METNSYDVIGVEDHLLFHGDNRYVLQHGGIEPESVQLTVTSPPYAFGKEYEKGQGEAELQALIEELTPLLYAVTKPSGFCLINCPMCSRFHRLPEQMYVDAFVDAGWIFHSRRIWSKPFAATRLAPSGIRMSIPSGEIENLLTFRKPPNSVENFDRKLAIRAIWTTPVGAVPDQMVKRDIHPAVFPVHLPIMAIRVWSKPGDVVLDPFGGTSTTVIAAQHEGRVGISIEKEQKYFDYAVQRVKDYVAQGQLFDSHTEYKPKPRQVKLGDGDDEKT